MIIDEIKPYLKQFNSIMFTWFHDMISPQFSNSINTACVGFEKDNTSCIKFYFNENFWNSLNYNEKCFLFTHEVLHVLFNHGYEGEKFINSLPEEMRSYELLNCTQDVVINEIIINQYITIPLKSMPYISKGYFINSLFNEKDLHLIKHNQSFEYYYYKYYELYGLSKPNENYQLLFDHSNLEEYNDEEVLPEIKIKEDNLFS